MEDDAETLVVSKGFWRDAGLRYLGTVAVGGAGAFALQLLGVMDDSPVIAAIVCLVVGFFLAWWVSRWELRSLKRDNERLTKEGLQLQDKHDGLQEKQDWLEENIGRIESDKSIGKFWCREVGPDQQGLPVLGKERMTRYIAVVNLKGGVGKTTLSANLAMAIADQLAFDERILVVDIDFQGTLSDRMIDLSRRSDFLNSRQVDHDLCTSTRLIQEEPVVIGDFESLIVPAAESQKIDVIQAHERLDQAGTLELIRAVTRPDYEVRFRHLANLHGGNVYPKYRYVIYDCPPRLTVSCINALAAADAFLVPTKLQADSIDAIGRTLKWAFKLKESHVTEAVPMGIVANEVRLHGGKFMKPYGDSYQVLKTQAETWTQEYGAEVQVFEHIVSHFKDFGRLQGGQTAYANLPDAKPVFDSLAEEAVGRMNGLVKR